MTRRTRSAKHKQSARPARPTSAYQAALMKKEELSDWLGSGSPLLAKFMSFWRQEGATEGVTRATMPVDISVKKIIEQQKLRVDMSEMFYLTTDIERLIEDASQTMPPYCMVAEDFPSTHGILWLETPLLFNVISDAEPMMVRAITWSRESVGRPGQSQGAGALTWNWLDSREAQRVMPSNTLGNKLARETPLFPAAYGSVRDGRVPWMAWDVEMAETDPARAVKVLDELPSVIAAFERYYKLVAVEEDFVPIPIGSEVIKSGIEDGHWTVRVPEGRVIHYEPDPITRFLQTFFTFMAQELPSMAVVKDTLPKPMIRRFRDKLINHSPISVIYWRRRESVPHNVGTGRQLEYRHPRRGHWRRNNRRKIDGVWQLYPVYIAPTIVGDPSLPFRARDVVNVVNR